MSERRSFLTDVTVVRCTNGAKKSLVVYTVRTSLSNRHNQSPLPKVVPPYFNTRLYRYSRNKAPHRICKNGKSRVALTYLTAKSDTCQRESLSNNLLQRRNSSTFGKEGGY